MLLAPPIIGNQEYDAESLSESTTTSSTYTQKLRLSLPSTIPAGRYRIGWSAEWSMDDENAQAQYRVQLDDTTDLAVYNMTPKKKYSTTTPPKYYGLSGFAYTQLTAAAHTVDLDFASGTGEDVYIRNARLEARRVGD